ncbi:MAG: V-type ATPase 116kDa subunit family protein [Syntrophales bacterium]|jgi:V/A-type H+-transporting ATPase subunit I|nr:V-type ATPase 116kDa subunit family protein [Syntrophales bacterium]
MTRIYVVGPSGRKEDTLRFLQRTGVVHVEPVAETSGDLEKAISVIEENLRKTCQSRDDLSRYQQISPEPASPPFAAGEALAALAGEKLSKIREIENRLQTVERLIHDLTPWGDFDPAVIRSLQHAGCHVQRFHMDDQQWKTFQPPDNVYLQVVARKPVVQFFTLSFGAPVEIPQAVSIAWPDVGLKAAVEERSRLRSAEKTIAGELSVIAARREELDAYCAAIRDEMHYFENLATLHMSEDLFGLQGWIPEEDEELLRKAVTGSGLPVQVHLRPPLAEEEPPLLLKNNWFVRRIEPLMRLYGLPKYRDVDPSHFFAPFMVLFFGLCLGDAGYGAALYLVCMGIEKKWGSKVEGLPMVLKLCRAFSVASVLIGLATGSVFGYNFTDRSWILVDLDINTGNPMILFYLSLGLGVVHLSLSYVIGMIQTPFVQMKIQKLAILLVVWGGAVLVSRKVWFAAPGADNVALLYAGSVCLALGILLTLLFASDHRHWGIRLGLGLWSIYGLTGLIGDVLSYARLFGLGIATSAIASVMNQLAGMAYNAAGPAAGAVLALLIILVGHVFNLALSLLGSTVHSARLHFVEAFKNFFEGGGVQYRPFRIEKN